MTIYRFIQYHHGKTQKTKGYLICCHGPLTAKKEPRTGRPRPAQQLAVG